MATKIRLARRGRKKRAMYDIVIADSRAPRDGKFIEKIGRYDPNTNPATVVLNDEKALDWVMKGAQPTDTTRAILSYRGVMYKKHLQVGVNKGALSQEDADKKYEAFMADKQARIQAKVDQLSADAQAAHKARMDAEAKVKEARAEALRKKQEEEAAAAAAEAAANEAPAEEEGEAEAPAAEEGAEG